MNLLEVIQNSNGSVTPELIIWALLIGFCIALAMALFSKRYMGKFVHTLLSQKIDAPEKAKTLEELGYKNNPFVRMALVGKSAYSGLIFEKSEEVIYKGDSVLPAVRRKVDFDSARFYIPKLLFPRAQIRYEKKGTHVMALVVGVIAFFALAMLALYYMPQIKEWVKDIF